MKRDEFFRDYLEKVGWVLNGEAFLFRFFLKPASFDADRIFNHLLDTGIIRGLLDDFFDEELRATGPDDESELLYREITLSDFAFDTSPDDPDKVFARGVALSAGEFLQCLLGTMVRVESPRGVLFSPYDKYLLLSEANEIAERFLKLLEFISSDWSYFYYKPADILALSQDNDFYFLNLGGDSCLVFHDSRENFFVLLTNGTD